MCGIAGIVDFRGYAVGREVLEGMCDRLLHRGPDDQGIFLDRDVGLGQRRLSIIDPSSGRQPMSNEDGSVWVIFNGEIYNFRELRAELESRGHRFSTRSDTEVIVHAYEQFGAECPGRFRGMFSFAIWDGRRRTLFLARDRVGKKPLFYTVAGGQFVFASELQALLQHPGICRELDPTALDDYLTYGYIPAPKTAFQGVYKLPPAHSLRLDVPERGTAAGEYRLKRYWRLKYAPKLVIDKEEATEALLERLTEAVRIRLVADVPLGALLSGGVDSSLVVALMSRLSDRPVKTFSIGFDEKAFNELPFARIVARRYGTDHHELIVRPKALDVLPTLVRHYGEPYADSSAVPSYYVAQLTRQHVKVALNGDGGDEDFAGYDRYQASGWADGYRKVPRPLRAMVVEPLARLVLPARARRSLLAQANRFLQVASQPAAARYLRWVTYFTPEQKRDLYAPEFQDRVRGHDAGAWILNLFAAARSDGVDRLDALLGTDVSSYLPYDLLVKMDIATMAVGLEARSPFLDHEVMEFAARLPGHYKLRGTTRKYILKRAARSLLPRATLNRRKMGFGMAVGDWLRGELRPLLYDVLSSPRAFGRGYFRPEAVHQLVSEHVAGDRDHTFRLWALLWFELWHREFLD